MGLGVKLREAGTRAWGAGAMGALLVAGVLVAGLGRSEPADRVALLSGAAWLPSSVGQVALLSGASARPMATLQVAHRGDDLDVVQSGSDGYVVDRSAGTVSRIDGGTFAQSTPYRFAADDPAKLSVLLGGGRVFVLDGAKGLLYRTDPKTLAVRGTPQVLDATVTPDSATVDGAGRLWVIDDRTGALKWFGGDPAGPAGTGTGSRSGAAPSGSRLVLAGSAAVLVGATGADWLDSDGSAAAHVDFGLHPDEAAVVSGTSDGRLAVVIAGRGVVELCTRTRCGTSAFPIDGAGARLGQAVLQSGLLFVPDLSHGTVHVLSTSAGRQLADPEILTPTADFALIPQDGQLFYNDPGSDRAGVLHLDGTFTATQKYEPGDPGKNIDTPAGSRSPLPSTPLPGSDRLSPTSASPAITTPRIPVIIRTSAVPTRLSSVATTVPEGTNQTTSADAITPPPLPTTGVAPTAPVGATSPELPTPVTTPPDPAPSSPFGPTSHQQRSTLPPPTTTPPTTTPPTTTPPTTTPPTTTPPTTTPPTTTPPTTTPPTTTPPTKPVVDAIDMITTYPTDIVSGDAIEFQARVSGGQPSGWSWSAGPDGQPGKLITGSSQSLAITADTGGAQEQAWTATVVVTNAAGPSAAKTLNFVVRLDDPTAVTDYQVNPSTVAPGAPVTVAPIISGTPTACTWAIGSGAAQDCSAPIAAPSTSGTYAVVVTVTNPRNQSKSAGNKTVTVVAPESLDVVIVGKGKVNVPAGPFLCPDSCSGSFPQNDQVAMVAMAAVGWQFNGWQGLGCYSSVYCSFAISQPVTATATFVSTCRLQERSYHQDSSGTGDITFEWDIPSSTGYAINTSTVSVRGQVSRGQASYSVLSMSPTMIRVLVTTKAGSLFQHSGEIDVWASYNECGA